MVHTFKFKIISCPIGVINDRNSSENIEHTPVVLFSFFIFLSLRFLLPRGFVHVKNLCYGVNEKCKQTPKLVLIGLLCKGLNRTSNLGIK